MSALETPLPEPLSPRQSEVLERALELLVEGGERALTTAGVARAANCSKESLYRWFGDRDGLLAAVVTHQASKVRGEAGAKLGRDRAAFQAALVAFAADLLGVLCGDVSLALNRLAIGQAGGRDATLGRLVLERGRRPIEARGRALLGEGRAAGHVAFDDAGAAWGTLYGLVVSDLHVRLLLGETPVPGERAIRARAAQAVDQFLRLHGADETRAGTVPAPTQET